MSFNKVNADGSITRVAGGTLYADAPVGAIMPYGGTTAPDGFLLCQGQAVNRTTYAELFKVIGTAFGAGDGSTTFNVPDLREATTKGVGLSGKSNNHFDSDGVALGEFVEDRLQAHTHSHKIGSSTAGSEEWVMFATSQVLSGMNQTDYGVVGRFGNTTEVKAIGVNYIIKATQVGAPADFAPVDMVENGNMKAVTSNAVYNTLVNTTIIQSNVKRSVTQDPTISTWYAASLEKPTIPTGKRLVRWLGFTDAEKMAASVGSTHGGVDNCILINGDTGDSTPITFNVWWGAEIADY